MINTNNRLLANRMLLLSAVAAAGAASGSGAAAATQGAAGAPKAMTAAQAAKLVRRPVPVVVEGKVVLVDGDDGHGNTIKVPKMKTIAVKEDEVLSFKDYGTHVVVVTKDGQKFSSADAGAATE